ncbi:unnamed protein product [Paramecium octaurelia]|uniref:Uncharacterized protein n=1 Tax=Paramecium octaurelia TaxID=43137 RepID=A0A8S1XM10_PAROT|nr:unnamed protein product [Paramecium octaurelia]
MLISVEIKRSKLFITSNWVSRNFRFHPNLYNDSRNHKPKNTSGLLSIKSQDNTRIDQESPLIGIRINLTYNPT